MRNKKKCKCGSLDVVYVVQKGRGRKLDFYCANCLPVEHHEHGDGESAHTEKSMETK